MELDEETANFFKSGGQEAPSESPAEVPSEPAAETPAPPKPEVPQSGTEKKKPSKFDYSPDTDNVTDDLGRKYIPLGAVQEARNENKKLRGELEEFRKKWEGGEQKLSQLLQKLQPKEEIPSFTEKPLDNLKARQDAIEAENKRLRDADERRNQESVQNNQIAEAQRNILVAERQFSSKTPDYGDALAVVQAAWREEYELAGVPENFIDTQLARKGLQFSHAALQKGQNPGEAVYKLAQRYGYKKASEEKKPDDKDKLKTIAKGQEAEKSLAGGKPASDMSLEALASMSEDELEEFVKDPKAWKKLSKAA